MRLRGRRIRTSMINLTKNLIGASVVSLPAAMVRSSLVPGLVVMALVCALCGASFVLIAYLCRLCGDGCTYRDIWCTAFGRRLGWVPDALIFCNGLLCCISYVILMTDYVQKSVVGLGGEVGRPLITWSFTLLLLLPLCRIRNLASLQCTSLIGLAIVACVFLYVSHSFFNDLPSAMHNLGENFLRLDRRIFSTVAITTGGFKAHYNAPRFFRELKNDLAAHTQVVIASFSFAFAAYASFAVTAVGLFGSEMDGNVLKNFSIGEGKAILLAWLGMAISTMFTFPLVFASLRESLEGMVPSLRCQGEDVVTCSMVVLISCVASSITDVSVVTGVGGAVMGSALCWVLPGAIYVKVALYGSSQSLSLNLPLLNKKATPLEVYPRMVAGSLLLIVFGTFATLSGLAASLGL